MNEHNRRFKMKRFEWRVTFPTGEWIGGVQDATGMGGAILALREAGKWPAEAQLDSGYGVSIKEVEE